MGGKNEGKTKQVDPIWDHCVKVGDGKKLRCKYCNNSYSCGVSRMKNHLAQTGNNVTPCKYVPDKVCDDFIKILRECKKKKDDVEEGESSNKKKRGPRDISREDLADEENNNDEVQEGDEEYIRSQTQQDPLQSQPVQQINMPPMQHSSSQQQQTQQDPLQSQPVQQNNRKRKGPSSSGAASSTGTGNTGTGNTVGSSPYSQPSTPSIHTPGDGVAMANNLQNVSGTLKQNPEHATEPSKGFSFNEVSSMRKSTNEVNCCHFSSDGILLAFSEHDKKVVLWNMETLQSLSTLEYHTMIITDVRFRPNTSQLATSSFDTTIRLWDARDPSYPIRTYTEHTSNVMSLDFHPKKTDVFCSCDTNNEMRYWNITQYNSTRVSKGGSGKVRFQPRTGQFMAAASGSVVSIYDVENDKQAHLLQRHSRDVSCLSWDTKGDLLASVSQDCVRIWSLNSGEFIHEFNSSGNSFYSCVFHPIDSNLLVIGGDQTLELWNLRENKPVSIQAHECLITAMAMSPATRMLAVVGYDKFGAGMTNLVDPSILN